MFDVCLRVSLWAGFLWLFLSGLCCAQSETTSPEYRQLRDQSGRVIDARILEVDNNRVTLEQRDGKRVTLPITTLSQTDREFLVAFARQRSEETADMHWPRFRGPTGMGISSATGVPVEWGREKNMRWKTALPGAGASSPIVYGDRVFVTCYTGYSVPGQPAGSLEQLRRHLIAVRLSDGQVLWEKSIPARLPEEERIREHGYAASTPVADAERIYVFFGKSGVFAFDHDGNQLWNADVGSGTSGWGSAASPILYKDILIVNACVESGSLVALDKRTGELRWQARDIVESWSTPVVIKVPTGRDELMLPMLRTLVAFDPESGRRLWWCRTEINWYKVPSVVSADGVVYCLGGRAGIASLAVRAGGSGDVTSSHRLWVSTNGSNVSSPIYWEGYLYWAHESRGLVYCVNAATGEVVYAQRLERARQIYASPVLAEGRLYYVTREGKTFVLAAKPEFQLLAVNDLSDGSVFNASPAVVQNCLLLRSDKYLYCIAENP